MTQLEIIGVGAVGTVIGTVIGLVGKFFFDRWNRNYVTEEACQSCNLKGELENLARDMIVVKKIALELAVTAGLRVEDFVRLAE